MTVNTTEWITLANNTSETILNWTKASVTITHWTDTTILINNTTSIPNATVIDLSRSFLVYNLVIGYISVIFMSIISLLYLYSVLRYMKKFILSGEIIGCGQCYFSCCCSPNKNLNIMIAARQREEEQARQKEPEEEEHSIVAPKTSRAKLGTFAAATMFGGKFTFFDEKMARKQPKTPKINKTKTGQATEIGFER